MRHVRRLHLKRNMVKKNGLFRVDFDQWKVAQWALYLETLAIRFGASVGASCDLRLYPVPDAVAVVNMLAFKLCDLLIFELKVFLADGALCQVKWYFVACQLELRKQVIELVFRRPSPACVRA